MNRIQEIVRELDIPEHEKIAIVTAVEKAHKDYCWKDQSVREGLRSLVGENNPKVSFLFTH